MCDTQTIKDPDSVFTRCPNRECPGRRWQLLKHFVGAMDIDGLGEKQVSLFMDLGWVQTAGDFYRLEAEQIAGQTGFGKVSAEKLASAIEASKQQPFGRVLFAPGSRRSATSPAGTWPSTSATIEALLNATPERSSRPRGSARRWPSRIHAQLADEHMRALFADLRKEGLTAGGGGTAAGPRPAGRQGVRADRHAARP